MVIPGSVESVSMSQ